MFVIFVTTILITLMGYSQVGNAIFTPILLAIWTLIAVLFANAGLMTLHYMPSTVGPALQASSWYTLGVLLALTELSITPSSYTVFFLSYLTVIFLAISLVNGIMALLKRRKEQTTFTE